VVRYADRDVDNREVLKMAGVRRVSRSILRYAFPLYVLAIVLQVYFAGEGIFGARDTDQTIEDSNQLNLHRDLGWFISQPFALLFLIVALLAWLPSTRLRVLSILFPILLIVQSILPAAGRWVAALHPVNAFVLLGMAGYLSWTFWRGELAPTVAVEEAPTAGPV
jgi:hypothetical protein